VERVRAVAAAARLASSRSLNPSRCPIAVSIRGERRLHWIEQALEPIAPEIDHDSLRRLTSALAPRVGAEAFVVLRDLSAGSPEEADDILGWAARARQRGTNRRPTLKATRHEAVDVRVVPSSRVGLRVRRTWRLRERRARSHTERAPADRLVGLVALSRCQELVPVLCDRDRAGNVRLDHLHDPGLVGCDAVPVEEPLEIGEQEAVFGGEFRDAAVKGIQAPSQLDRREPRKTELAPSQVVIAVARVITVLTTTRAPSDSIRCAIW
jgi:hypothetical protein